LFLRPAAGRPDVVAADAARLTEELLSGLTAGDDVEHVVVRGGTEGLHIGLFSLCPDIALARQRATLTCARLIARHPAFSGWQVSDD
jgi:hypothetical protein